MISTWVATLLFVLIDLDVACSFAVQDFTWLYFSLAHFFFFFAAAAAAAAVVVSLAARETLGIKDPPLLHGFALGLLFFSFLFALL